MNFSKLKVVWSLKQSLQWLNSLRKLSLMEKLNSCLVFVASYNIQENVLEFETSRVILKISVKYYHI